MTIDLCKLFNVEEGEEFRFKTKDNWYSDFKYKIENNIMKVAYIGSENNKFQPSSFNLNDFKLIDEIIKFPKKKQFSNDELHIFKMIPRVYKWCARDRNGNLFVYESKPYKSDSELFWNNDHDYKHIKVFNHLFKSILWEDTEPVFIDDYVERQV